MPHSRAEAVTVRRDLTCRTASDALKLLKYFVLDARVLHQGVHDSTKMLRFRDCFIRHPLGDCAQTNTEELAPLTSLVKTASINKFPQGTAKFTRPRGPPTLLS